MTGIVARLRAPRAHPSVAAHGITGLILILLVAFGLTGCADDNQSGRPPNYWINHLSLEGGGG